jgi:hypothetical protein
MPKIQAAHITCCTQPLASRWVRDGVHEYLQTEEVEQTFEQFRDFLVESFHSYTIGTGWMNYDMFVRFTKEYAFSLLGLSSTEIAKVFLVRLR